MHAERERIFQEAVLSLLGVEWNPHQREKAEVQPRQKIGTACGGRNLRECKQRFGRGLALACSSCGTAYEKARS